MAGGEIVPAITTQQRLFVDCWWANGGDMIAAIDFAGYRGFTHDSEKASKGRRLLASRSVKRYIEYLRTRERAEKKALVKDRSGPDQKSESGKNVANCASISDANLNQIAHGIDAQIDARIDGIQPVFTPRREEVQGAVRLEPTAAGSLLPPVIAVPCKAVGRELTVQEVRELLANIARGNERSMSDSRTRMRAIELAMRNMGMLVDMQLTANATVAGPDVRAMTAEERSAELQKLEAFFADIKDAADPADSGSE